MADKELSTALNSGGINTIFLGGTASTDKVIKKSDMVAAGISFDDTGDAPREMKVIQIRNGKYELYE